MSSNATEMLWNLGHHLVMAAVVNTVLVPMYRILITHIWPEKEQQKYWPIEMQHHITLDSHLLTDQCL